MMGRTVQTVTEEGGCTKETVIALIQDKILSLSQNVERLCHVLFGNGSPGLKGDVAALQDKRIVDSAAIERIEKRVEKIESSVDGLKKAVYILAGAAGVLQLVLKVL